MDVSKLTMEDAMQALGYPQSAILASVRERKPRVIDTFDILICRDDDYGDAELEQLYGQEPLPPNQGFQLPVEELIETEP